MINSFVDHAKGKGWSAGTKGYHPRDLVLNREKTHLLVEAKTVGANAELAVRAAIGQLFTYQFLYYPAGTNKVALFRRPSATCG